MSNGISANAGHVQRPDGLLALASTLPTDVSHSPLLGIVGVVMGAAIVTLAGRLLSLGLADLKGNVGIGFDEGAWISSAFNVAIMFIGPLTVYLGAILGARRVLLFSSAVFALVSVALPYVHSYSLMICLLAIAGLSSGTFYPLTLSFVLRNIPLRYLALAIALYATAVEGAVNFAPSLYGFYRDHLSWTWMFWTSALVAPVMTACVYYGIPAAPGPRPAGRKPSFAGFLYASVGLALLYAALDQGQRLDWWRSGLFTALFTTGAFFLLCAVVRRLRRPNPLVDLPYLGKWNTLVLAFGLFVGCVPLLPSARDGSRHPSDACRAWIRRGAIRPRGAMDGRAGVVPRVRRRSFTEQGPRFAPVDGERLCDDRVRMPHERESHKRVDRRELLSVRAAHGRRAVVRVRGARQHADPAVVLLRRPRLSVPCADVLRIPPHRTSLRWASRRRGVGPLHRRAGEAFTRTSWACTSSQVTGS